MEEEVKVPKKRGPKPKNVVLNTEVVENTMIEHTIKVSDEPVLKYSESGVISYNGLQPKTEGSAGIDLMSQVAFRLIPGETKIIPTGLSVAIPKGFVGLVCSRSGLAAKNQIQVLNAPGIIDSDYRGEIKVILYNAGRQHFTATLGDRIAQLVIVPYALLPVEKVDILDETDRGSGGLGSTGK